MCPLLHTQMSRIVHLVRTPPPSPLLHTHAHALAHARTHVGNATDMRPTRITFFVKINGSDTASKAKQGSWGATFVLHAKAKRAPAPPANESESYMHPPQSSGDEDRSGDGDEDEEYDTGANVYAEELRRLQEQAAAMGTDDVDDADVDLDEYDTGNTGDGRQRSLDIRPY